MLDFTTIYSYDTLELITNNNKSINKSDKDFVSIIECLKKMSSSDAEISFFDKESKEIMPKNFVKKSHAK